ncbi:hypothetical protein MAHJHV54_48950 [Mycobacterium avium subsp. hominissuis]
MIGSVESPDRSRPSIRRIGRGPAPAIVDGARELSYRELDEWSTRLARKLIQHGVGPERAVGAHTVLDQLARQAC